MVEAFFRYSFKTNYKTDSPAPPTKEKHGLRLPTGPRLTVLLGQVLRQVREDVFVHRQGAHGFQGRGKLLGASAMAHKNRIRFHPFSPSFRRFLERFASLGLEWKSAAGGKFAEVCWWMLGREKYSLGSVFWWFCGEDKSFSGFKGNSLAIEWTGQNKSEILCLPLKWSSHGSGLFCGCFHGKILTSDRVDLLANFDGCSFSLGGCLRVKGRQTENHQFGGGGAVCGFGTCD